METTFEKKLIDKVKKRELEVLFGGDDLEGNFTGHFSDVIREVIQDKYELKVKASFYGDELLELAEDGAVDIFILILNNIIFNPPEIPFKKRIENVLQLIAQIKFTYRKPVIATWGYPSGDRSFAARVKLVGADFLFQLPLKRKPFVEAIEKCLDMLPEFNEIERK
jgi:hypothetical protein